MLIFARQCKSQMVLQCLAKEKRWMQLPDLNKASSIKPLSGLIFLFSRQLQRLLLLPLRLYFSVK